MMEKGDEPLESCISTRMLVGWTTICVNASFDIRDVRSPVYVNWIDCPKVQRYSTQLGSSGL